MVNRKELLPTTAPAETWIRTHSALQVHQCRSHNVWHRPRLNRCQHLDDRNALQPRHNTQDDCNHHHQRRPEVNSSTPLPDIAALHQQPSHKKS